jgi:hypothetical protein
MVSTYTANKRIEQPGFNDYIDTWDVPINNDWGIIDLALGGSVSINTTGLSGNQTLGTAQYQPLKIVLTGTPTAAIKYRVPSGVGGMWVVRNDTTGGQTVTIDSIAGGSAVTIPAGQNTLVTCDGTASGMVLAINTSPVAAGSNTQVQYNNSGVLGGDAKFTFNGTTVLVPALNVTGNLTIGDASGDTITINATTAAIPNGLNIGSNNLYLNGTKVGIGTATLGAERLTVAGVVYSTAGGFKFPDGTTQTSAASGTTPGGSNTQVQFNDGGAFGGDSGLTFNKTTNALTVGGLLTAGGATLSSTLTMSAAVNNAARVNLASASSPNLGATASNYVRITGTTTINGFSSANSGIYRDILFDDALTLVDGSSFRLPNGGNDIDVAVGDRAGFVSDGSGVWRCLWYQRADGSALAPGPGYTATNTSVTSISAAYSTPFEITEGTQLFSRTYTPRNDSTILISVDVAGCYGQLSTVALGIFINGATNAVATAIVTFPNSAAAGYPNRVVYSMVSNGSPVVITARIAGGATSLGTAVFVIQEFVA